MSLNQLQVVAEIAALDDHFWTMCLVHVLPGLPLLPDLSIDEFEDGPAIPARKLAGDSRKDLSIRGCWALFSAP